MTMRHKLKKHSLKFLSLFLSVFLWAYILNSEKIRFEKIVYLDYILPDQLIFNQKPPQEVTFYIEGPRAFVKTVLDREDRILIDLNRANFKRQMSFYVDFNPAQLHLPIGMSVENVSLRRIPVKLEKKTTKLLPIKADFSGPLPEIYSFQKFQFLPSEVEVQGPKSVLDSLKHIATRPIDFDTLLGQEMVPIELAFPDDRLSVSTNFDIKLNYQIKMSSTEISLNDVPIKFLSKKKMSSSVKSVRLKLKVPEKFNKSRSNISSSIQVWADVPDRAKGQLTVPLNVVLPPGFELLEVFPKSILVNIQ